LRYDTISFLSDYGLADEFVGVAKSVIRQIAPAVSVIDVTHDLAPHDVRGGALALARSAQYLCPGLVLAVVDPGVGTDRRPVAVEVGDGMSILVGPDNGLLAPAVAMVGGADRAVVLDRPDYHLPGPGATFDGRDIFAPVAAHLCAGVALTDLGTEIPVAGLQPGVLPISRREGDALEAEILWIDRFGNAQLNVDPDDLEAFGARLTLTVGDRTQAAGRVGSFAEIGVGRIGLIIDSYGLLAIAANQMSAAAELDLAPGDQVTIRTIDDAENPDSGTRSVPVAMSPRSGSPRSGGER